MINLSKPIENLTSLDLEKYAVWQYVSNDHSGETVVRPVKKIPVANFLNRVVGDYVYFSNGLKVLGLIGNIDIENAKLTEHFLTLSLLREGKWYSLPRYHDFDYSERGPAALADFFGLSVDDIYPISFDVRRFSVGSEAVLSGKIFKEPPGKLSRAEIIALAVP
jgi:hypothetical protein